MGLNSWGCGAKLRYTYINHRGGELKLTLSPTPSLCDRLYLELVSLWVSRRFRPESFSIAPVNDDKSV